MIYIVSFYAVLFCVWWWRRRRKNQLKLELNVLTLLRKILKVTIEKSSKKPDEQVALLLMMPLVLFGTKDKRFSELNTDENLVIVSCYYYEILRECISYKYNNNLALQNVCFKSQSLFDKCALQAFKGDVDKIKFLKSLCLNRVPGRSSIEDVMSVLLINNRSLDVYWLQGLKPLGAYRKTRQSE